MTDDANGDYTYTPPADITTSAAYVFSVQADPNGLYGAGSATSNVQVDQAATSVTNVIATPNNVGVGSRTWFSPAPSPPRRRAARRCR